MLAAGPERPNPAESQGPRPNRIKMPGRSARCRVDFAAAAEKWETVTQFLQDEFAGG